MNILKGIFVNRKQVQPKSSTVFGSSLRKENQKEYTCSLQDWEKQEPERCQFVDSEKYNLLVKDKYCLVHEDKLWNFEDNEDKEIFGQALEEAVVFNGIKLDTRLYQKQTHFSECDAWRVEIVEHKPCSHCITYFKIAGLLWCYLEAVSIVYGCALDSTSAGIGIKLIVPRRKINQELWSYINAKFEYVETKKGIFLIRPLPGVHLDYPFPDPRLILDLPLQLAPEGGTISNVMLPLMEK